MSEQTRFTLLDIGQVATKTRYSRTSIYDFGKIGGPRYDEHFPKARKLGLRRTVWIESEIDQWIKSRVRAYNSGDSVVSGIGEMQS